MDALLPTSATPVPAFAAAPVAAASRIVAWCRPALALLLAFALLAILAADPLQMGRPAQVALGLFGLALIAWTVLRADDTAVAIAALLGLLLAGAVTPAQFHAALGQDLIWLMVGGFVLAAALRASGLAERWTLRCTQSAGSTLALMQRLTLLIAASAFVVPSTSGRAALLLPVFLCLARALDQPRLTRALALLFPSVILLSAGASLLGAGAHLVALDALRRHGVDAPGWLGWLALAAPFSLAASWLACHVIAWTTLDAAERRAPLALPRAERSPLTRQQRAVLWVVVITVLGWMAAPSLGLDPAALALAGALAATCKRWTGIDLKSALKQVEWGLLLFLAATTAMADALTGSGAAASLARASLAALPEAARQPPALMAAAVLIALLAHTVVASRTARVVVLLPALALPLIAAGLHPAPVILAITLGSGFCQSFQVSAKPISVFARTELPTFSDADLLRLSLLLLPGVAALLLVTVLGYWPLLGLPLRAG